MQYRKYTVFIAAFYCAALWLLPQAAAAPPALREFPAPEAHQGVAVDTAHVYAIDNQTIAKYDKFTGERVAIWKASDDTPMTHLNSGVVWEGKLYCAHSNYPGIPMTSSIEIWDTATLTHIATHSFGILYGSLTWMDRHDGFWWGCFAHYDKRGGYPDKDHSHTTVVKFDDDWRALEAWVLPKAMLAEAHPYSSSGGAWGPDGRLYCTGHDGPQLYVLALPKAGSTLELVEKISFPIDGQAIAFDRSGSNLLHGILRDEKKVIAAPLP